MSIKKGLFKRVSTIFFFLITFFCLSVNVFAASFAYDKFDWNSFLEQHKNYWISDCAKDDEDCVDEVLKTKEKFYTRLYELLAQFNKKGYFIDDNIIIETVFFGLTPDSFADADKIESEDGESGYTIDESETKNSYIASADETAYEYFERETDTLKTLMNNMIGYYRECYGYSGVPVTSTDSNGNSILTCSDSNATIVDGECWVKVKSLKTNYFDSIGLASNISLIGSCMEATTNYSAYKLSDASSNKEVNEEIYWDFLINNKYFDKKSQLQSYFSSVLSKTHRNNMSELSIFEYEIYEEEIKEARTNIVDDIKDILDSYGNFAETPNSSWTYLNGYSSSSSFWWPIGSSETTGSGNVIMAVGEPESIKVTSKFGYRTSPKPGFHYGVDIAGVTGRANVIAAKSGIVVYSTLTRGISCPDANDVNSNCGGSYGNRVVIQHSDGSYTLYAHLAQNTVLVEEGDSVLQGHVIGKVGSSGASTGGHLHFEIRMGANSVANLVDPLNYISATEPRKTGAGYVYDENGNVISDGSLNNAITFIHTWEGTPKSIGDDYVAFDDGYGNITIGYGILVEAHKDKFEALGVNVDNVTVGSTIPKDIVDTVETQIIQGMSDSVKAMLSNNALTLEYYQIDALISRVYNCGTSGIKDFASYYKQYGVTEALYENYLSKPYTASGRVSTGLQRRRLAEWMLFSQGQYE